MDKRLSVILLSYNDYLNVHRRLFQLSKMLDEKTELIWIDNASTELEFENAYTFWRGVYKRMGRRFTSIRMKRNVGFQDGFNYGVSKAEWGENILLTQPDVLFRDLNFITALRKSYLPETMILGGRLISWDGGWNSLVAVDGNKYTVPYLEGWLLYMDKGVYQDIGGFDNRYAPADMEDVDFSLTALSKGYELAEIENKDFTHLGGKSFEASNLSSTREQRTRINKQKFDDKWKTDIVGIFGG